MIIILFSRANTLFVRFDITKNINSEIMPIDVILACTPIKNMGANFLKNRVQENDATILVKPRK